MREAEVLHANLIAKPLAEVMAARSLSKDQVELANQLVSPQFDTAWRSFLYGVVGNAGNLVQVAASQLGNVGGRPYWSWYGFSGRVEWCACFVSWCANECGYIEAGAIPKFSYCPTGGQWFKDAGRWAPRGAVPEPGAIIFFDWYDDGVSNHVGIVESCDGTTVCTMEGNSGDACARRAYAIDSGSIMGYGVVKRTR